MRTEPESFEAAYASETDPWAFATSQYELSKYATTISALGSDHYRRCFEPGCSIGVLTELLTQRVDEVIACDASASAVRQARDRTAQSARARIINATIPQWWPSGRFDLIVLSELGYYWDRAGFDTVLDLCRHSLVDGGAEVIAVHWLGTSADHVRSGAEVHEQLCDRLGPSDLHDRRPGEPGTPSEAGFVLDRWRGVARD
ncbi:MAG: SAM-dependent methyltransferase [Ilumatobacteraceae bacterium]|nr:SAM-dependent methyltransferase [Ilumatobacteraceae bacterium]